MVQSFKILTKRLILSLLLTAIMIAGCSVSIAQPVFEAHPIWKASRGNQEIILIGEVHGKAVPEIDAKLAVDLFNDREVWIEWRLNDMQIKQQLMQTYVYKPTKNQVEKVYLKLIPKYGADALALATRTFEFPAILSLLMIHNLVHRPASLPPAQSDLSQSLTALATREFQHKVRLLDSPEVWLQAAATCGNAVESGQMLDAVLTGSTDILGRAYSEFQKNWDGRQFRSAFAGESAQFLFDPFRRRYYECYVRPRDALWAKKLSSSNADKVVAIVGANHLVGPSNLLELLREQGFSILEMYE